MSTIDDTYPLEIVERCLRWTKQDEGKIFWRWIRSELERVSANERYIGAWKTEEIMEANRAIGRQEMTQFIADFPKMLDLLIRAKKSSGNDLTSLDEIQ